jgi:hypothetical protein
MQTALIDLLEQLINFAMVTHNDHEILVHQQYLHQGLQLVTSKLKEITGIYINQSAYHLLIIHILIYY